MRINFQSNYGTTDRYYDNIFLRKYTSAEPTISLSQEYPSDYGLVAEWHFDEGSGNVTEDSSGNGNDGTIYGATWTTGVSGTALEFDGVDEYVDVEDDIHSATTGSMEAWIKLDDTSAYAYEIIDVGKSGSDYFVFDIQYGKVIHFLKTGGTVRWKYRTIQTLSPGVWYHIIVTQDGIAPKTYINGDEVSTELESGSTSYNS